jgi:hypothetical protein
MASDGEKNALATTGLPGSHLVLGAYAMCRLGQHGLVVGAPACSLRDAHPRSRSLRVLLLIDPICGHSAHSLAL